MFEDEDANLSDLSFQSGVSKAPQRRVMQQILMFIINLPQTSESRDLLQTELEENDCYMCCRESMQLIKKFKLAIISCDKTNVYN